MTQARWINHCHIGDCRDTLRRMAADGVRVQMCVTSPPYWGLRDYGTARWEGGSEDGCDHVQRVMRPSVNSTLEDHGADGRSPQLDAIPGIPYRDTCGKCGAHRIDSQLGLEATPEEYIANMVEVFRLVREVLADDGTLWVNMGDSYASTISGTGARGGSFASERLQWQGEPTRKDIPPGLKPKDLVGMPWRLAFALQADDWYLRSDIIWHKPNPMPESVTDRPTKSHEYLFLLSKQANYYYDANAVREAAATDNRSRSNWNERKLTEPMRRGDPAQSGHITSTATLASRAGRNLRTVWTIASQPYSEAHFATFPQKLVDPCILAGTSERGHCPECGKLWERVVDREKPPEEAFNKARVMVDENVKMSPLHRSGKASGQKMQDWLDAHPAKTLGFRPTCPHNLAPIPDIVLDPFFGSGTVGQVAENLGRSWIGLELNPEYVKMSEKRTAQMGMAL